MANESDSSSEGDLADGSSPVAHSEEDAKMLSILPERVRSGVNPARAALVDVALDLDLCPVFHEILHGEHEVERRELRTAVVTQEELDSINGHPLLGGWTSDNRSGVAGTLHRISRNVDPVTNKVVGMTIRMARAQYGMLDPVDALKTSLRNKKSLLVLGPPGCGKTTLLREVARVLDEEFSRRVVIIDTSSEIAGFGQVRHPAVGRTTRRRKVANREHQHKDMLEAVQNDTPQVLVIDEIGSAQEVEAACSIGFRGICLVATAHACSLQDAMNNPTLQPLFGGFEKSTISDETARRSYGGRRFVEERRNDPVFQSLVELGEGAGDRWTIYPDLKGAVDDVLRERSPQRIFHQPNVGYSRENLAHGMHPARGSRMKSSGNQGTGVYLLCFDGGVARGEARSPGGAGAVLKQLKSRQLKSSPHAQSARRNRHTWKIYLARASPEQMEYAGLLIGLRGVLDVLSTLNPPAKKILIKGDCRFVIDRHGGSQPVQVLASEHPDVHPKMQRLADIVNEVLAKLRQKVEVPDPQWRSRSRNKTADRLTNEARNLKQTDAAVRLTQEEWQLLQGYDLDVLDTKFSTQETHPMSTSRPAPQKRTATALADDTPMSARQVLDGLPGGYPDSIDDWAKIQSKVWRNAPRLPNGWIRVWSKRHDCEYYLRLGDNYATFDCDDVK